MAKQKRRSAVTGRDLLVAALQVRAEELTCRKHHLLGLWTSAKKKHGTGAKKALCLCCGAGVIVSPCIPNVLPKRQSAPGIKGEALFEECEIPPDSLTV